ncbi:sulfatase family protein [Halorientalis salina]|uniref:sulfatase family protein n=1 Tax=Halorientalis salina TaxID=2932266 RepID=UPI0010AC8F4A|nr:sulfatase [Halorientalis salina]
MPRKKNVIYLAVDALRPDYLGCYGNESVLTTEIDRLADNGVVFDDVTSSAPWTVPSVATHLTGKYAHRMNIFSSEFDLNDEPVQTVFEHFSSKGYTTAAFLDSESLYEQWDKDVDYYAKSLDLTNLLDFITQQGDEPFFLFNLYRGTHLPYVLKYSKEAWYRAQEEGLDKLRSNDEDDLREMKYRYQNAIEHFSEWYLRAIIDRLKREDLLEDTAIIITADHGETWGERREDRSDMDAFDLHGPSLYNEVLKVPLILYNLGTETGIRITEPVRSIDILPTLYESVGIEKDVNHHLDGISLSPAIEGDTAAVDYPSIAFSATTRYENPSERDISAISNFSVIRDTWKLIWDPENDTEELYNVKSDPDERTDVSEQNTEVVAELRKILEDEIENVGVMKDGADSDIVQERLEDLGYL